MKSTQYRGFKIDPVFNYDNGKSDFQFARISDPEDCGIGRGTLEDAKEIIDERLIERPELYEVRISKGTEVPIRGFLEALDFARYWNAELLVNFQNP